MFRAATLVSFTTNSNTDHDTDTSHASQQSKHHNIQHILAWHSTKNIQLKEPDMSFTLSVLCVNQYMVLSDINVNQLGVHRKKCLGQKTCNIQHLY